MEADAAPAGVSAHIVRRHLIYTRMAQDVHIKGLYIGGVITQVSASCPCLFVKKRRPFPVLMKKKLPDVNHSLIRNNQIDL